MDLPIHRWLGGTKCEKVNWCSRFLFQHLILVCTAARMHTFHPRTQRLKRGLLQEFRDTGLGRENKVLPFCPIMAAGLLC